MRDYILKNWSFSHVLVLFGSRSKARLINCGVNMKRFYIALVAIASYLWAWLPLAHTSQVRPVPDFDQNGTVDISDFLLFVGKFGSKQGDEMYEDRFDLDGNGTVDISDFLIFVKDFGKASPESGDENDVNIPDANLRAVIADSLGKGRDEAITRAEMASLTHLEAQGANISDLTGLQFATNLTYLWLTGNATNRPFRVV